MNVVGYSEFVSRKLASVTPTGLAAVPALDGLDLMPHQRDLVAWALRRGRCAIFADTGLGKTRMQLAWAHEVHKATGHAVLILAPLAVAAQTVAEGESIGIAVTHCREPEDVRPGLNITNYDRLHKFDPEAFGAVVLDESSCIKHHDTKTLAQLLEAFMRTPFKLCATATPAPNDWTELGTHAEFLGICSRQEMLAEYFVHDGGETQVWRLKGHARGQFWRWVSSWGAMVRKPSDLGHDDTAYNLPPLTVTEHLVETEASTAGMLFALEAQTLSERREARKASMADRVAECALLIKSEWSKLAEDKQEFCHELEARVRGSAQSPRSRESGIKGKATSVGKGKSGEEQGVAEGVHEGVLQKEPGKVSSDPGTTRYSERETSGEVRQGRGMARGAQGVGEGLAGVEPGQAQGSEIEGSRDRTERLSGHAGHAERPLRDMRLLGHEQSEILSGSGSLPQDGNHSRPTLHELQSGAGEVQGQRERPYGRGRVPLEAWVIWCELNSEQDALERHFGKLAFSVRGSMTPEEKEAAIFGWLAGERPVMISKPSIMGWGINAQHCARMAFVGVTDSFEAYYQAVRRCWRFGQRREVAVHIFASQLEGAIVANLKRKEAAAQSMAEQLSAETRDAVREQVAGTSRKTNAYAPRQRIAAPAWLQTEHAA
jgi:hypothetical protein